jgi:hypothetical protein
MLQNKGQGYHAIQDCVTEEKKSIDWVHANIQLQLQK